MAGKSPREKDLDKTIELLLVEDSPTDVFLIRESLLFCSVAVHVTTAYDGAKALSFLNGGYRPDLVILDLNIPKINGLQLLAQSEAKEIPIVVFSSSQNPEHRKQALELGARGYVHKPIDLDSFKRAVCGIVEQMAFAG